MPEAKRARYTDGMASPSAPLQFDLPAQPDLSRITVEAGKLGGRPCIRRMRIGVSDVLELLAGGMSPAEVLEDFPDLELGDIAASLAYAALAVDAPGIRAR